MATEYDTVKMLEELKSIFSWYEIDCRKEYNVIRGGYTLFRTLDSVEYSCDFLLEIHLCKDIPSVYLPNDTWWIKKGGFNHFYKEGNCCLGTRTGIMYAWGMNRNAESFLENVVDAFLINAISKKDTGTAAIGELSHKTGKKDYFADLLCVNVDELKTVLRRAKIILKTRNLPPDSMCICRKSKASMCNCGGKKFLEACFKDKVLAKTFLDEIKSLRGL